MNAAPSGNLCFRIDTDRGPVLQKIYLARRGAVRSALRTLFAALARQKTGTSPHTRWATEKAVLAHWRARGFDVPADVSDQHRDLARTGVSVIEFVDGQVLQTLLAETHRTRAERDAVLTRFAAQWARRHRAALETGDSWLVQEHGGFEHVLVAGDRMVTFDFEQAYRPGREILPLILREVAGYLRSLEKRVPDALFAADLRTLVAGYSEPLLLRRCLDSQSHHANPLRRLAYAFDRDVWRRLGRGGRKYEALALLQAALRDAAP
jgi:hypothetical protein